jgi:hypothetical protein
VRADIIGGVVVFEENGQYDVPIETRLPHRLKLDGDKIVDRFPGKSDDEVRQWDHDHPLTGPEPAPVEPGTPTTPDSPTAVIEARLDDLQQQLDAVTTMILEG